jgi:hypothetical protein
MQTLPEQIKERKEELKQLCREGNVLALVILHTVRAHAVDEAPTYIQWCLDNMRDWDDNRQKT